MLFGIETSQHPVIVFKGFFYVGLTLICGICLLIHLAPVHLAPAVFSQVRCIFHFLELNGFCGLLCLKSWFCTKDKDKR